MTNKTACIILNYKGAASTIRLIQTLRASTFTNIEIFVIENGSPDNSLEQLRTYVDPEHLVHTPVNLGYAGGMNLGIQRALQSDAQFFWLLTKDLTVEPQALAELHSLWPKLERPGMVGSLTDLNGTDQIYFFQAKIDSRGRTRHGTKGRSIAEIPELMKPYGTTDYVNGSCIFTHRNVIEQVGLIPDDYFLYFEDCDWGLRAKRLGYNHYVCYRSRIHHHREIGGFNRTAEYYCRRNAYLFKRKNGFARPWSKMFALFGHRKSALKARWRGDTKLLEVLNAVIEDVKHEKSGLGPWR